MKIQSILRSTTLLCLTLVSMSASQAAPVVAISDLYNTGMSTPWNSVTPTPTPGSDLPPGTPNKVSDPNWTVDAPGVIRDGTSATLSNATGKFNGNQFTRFQQNLGYDPANPVQNSVMYNSQWITDPPYAPGNQDPAGTYVFTTTFTTSVPLTTINISGYIRAPNGSLAYSLNGGAPVTIRAAAPNNGNHSPFLAPLPFTITGSGGLLNTLSFIFVLPSGPNIAAIRVQFNNATFTVPEPSSLCLSAMGLFGFVAYRWRKRPAGPKTNA